MRENIYWTANPTGAADFADLLRSDWQHSEIGPPEFWSPELVSALSIAFHSLNPTAILWGADLRVFAPRSYRQIVGAHPLLQGAPLVAQRREYANMIQHAIAVADQTDRLLEAESAEGMFFSLAPIRDRRGTIQGYAHQQLDPIQQDGTAATGWQSILLHLGDEMRRAKSEPEIIGASARVLGETLGLDRTGFALPDPKADLVRIAGQWCREGMDSLPASFRSEELGTGDDALRKGKSIWLGDAPRELAETDPRLAALIKRFNIKAMVNIPIERGGEVIAHFFGHYSAARTWHYDRIMLLREAVERTWSAVERQRAQIAARDAEFRLRMALEASGLATWDWDIDSDEIQWSASHFHILGYAPNGISPTYGIWLNCVHPEDRKLTDAKVAETRASCASFSHSYRIVRPDGEVRWCVARGRFFDDATGVARRMIGVVEDVTDRRVAEGRIRESEQRYRLIVENAKDYAIFTTDPDGVVTGWPPGAEAVFGWTESEALGRNASFIFTHEDRMNGVPEQELERARQREWAPDVRWHLHKDGHQVFIDGVVRPIQNGGRIQGFLKMGQDVTQRRRHEIALEESEARFRMLATSVPHLVFRSTGNGLRTWASPQWETYTGMKETEGRGLKWAETIHPDDRERTLAAWTEARAKDNGEYYVEHRIRRHDGTYRWHQSRAVPLHHSGMEDDEWVGSAADVHDMRELQERQKVLVAELQHRTRNLLAVVRAVADQTMATVATPQQFRSAFGSRLRALSRVQGLLSHHGQDAAIGQIIKMELEATAPLWHQIVLEGPDVSVRQSTVQTLALAIHELCTNALKYGALASPEGMLTVTWRNEFSGGKTWLVMDWRESFPSRARADPPAKGGGYGRELIEHALPYQLGARTAFDLKDTSLACLIAIPL